MTLEAFNQASREAAAAMVRPCLDIQRWIDAMVNARPYPDLAALLEHASTVASPFNEAEVTAALVHHPRIGERAPGHGAEAELSSTEQASLGASTAERDRAIKQGNLDYERKFGRVFLIRAAGRDRGEILSELRRRLANDDAAELQVVAGQLREIALGRLENVLDA